MPARLFAKRSFSIAFLLSLFATNVLAQRLEIPRRHDRPPGPPVSAKEAVAKMSVPKGFQVEIVAEEPDIVNPVAMAIDAQGRFWITESLEYPRREPGQGKDRIKVLEDTDDDGRMDKVTVFADGLNIPSGIAVGYGGVWVANAPDLLFYEDTNGDLKADKVMTLLTGFGRTDTHELPNAFTWGPDGWLYSWNGVFNYSSVKYAKDNPNFDEKHPGWDFTCAVWRIHPRTKEFQIFAEGTSNPWGIAINPQGDFFASACVIDHLWHITEGAYYIRQGGPYPAHTWPLGSIVEHAHQKAAYCGITYYDSDAYPKSYRNVLYMGNIHGGCLNSDIIEPVGSSYFGKPKADLMTANDAWFMPVSQLTGPDGCLYVLDWYDQYHCYQDANADPEGVERAKGRLYRLTYSGNDASVKKTRLAPKDMTSLDDVGLVRLLESDNGFERSTAQRLLSERAKATTIELLSKVILDTNQSERTRLHALWAVGASTDLDRAGQVLAKITQADGDALYKWCIRLLGNYAQQGNSFASNQLRKTIQPSEVHSAPVTLNAIVALSKVKEFTPAERAKAIIQLAASHPEDETIQHVAYNFIRRSGQEPKLVDSLVETYQGQQSFGAFASEWAPGLLSWSKELPNVEASQIAELCNVFVSAREQSALQISVMQWILDGLISGKSDFGFAEAIRSRVGEKLEQLASSNEESVSVMSTLVLAGLRDSKAIAELEKITLTEKVDDEIRLAAVRTLVVSQPERLETLVPKLVTQSKIPVEQRAQVIDTLGSASLDGVSKWLATHYQELDSPLQSRVIELLTQRPAWAIILIDQVATGNIPVDRFNLNHLRRLATFKDVQLQTKVAKVFGTVRESNSEERGRVVNRMRDMLGGMSGDPFAGRAVFKRVCSQCHVLHGEGYEVGPDITRNGRNNWQQLIQNVFDPSAVIGPGFQAVIVLTDDGRVLTGVPTEETDQTIALKMQGGKVESLSKDTIEEIKRSDVSLMPEQIENQMTSQEAADLFAFLALDKPPEDPAAVLLSGAPPQKVREKTTP